MTDYFAMKEKVMEVIRNNADELFALNCDIADHPELSGKEYETSKKIVNFLRGKGYDVEYPFDGLDTAFRATWGPRRERKVAILTEYDALPEIGHACGHSLSGSISILAGLALKDLSEELNASIDVIGTPTEEEDGAKCKMVDDGLFDDYDMAIMVHLNNANTVQPTLLALNSNMYVFHGKAAHASAKPWDGINAFNAGQLMFHAVDMLRQHVTPDVRLHGIFRNGGEAPNVVPETVSLEMYMRALSRPYLNELIDKVFKCAEAGCLATGATYTWYETAHPYDDIRVNKTGLDVLREVYAELGLEENEPDGTIFGSSDVGNVSYRCPCFQPCLQLVPADVPIHTREFESYVRSDKARECLETGAEIIAFPILKIFGDEEKYQAMKRDFLEQE